MNRELKIGPEGPTSSTSVPPPPDDLRHLDRLATFGLLAAGVVHELEAALKVATNHTAAIASGEVEGEDARAKARIVGQQLERMTERFRRLHSFGQGDPPRRERADLCGIVRQVAELFVPLAAKRGVTVRLVSDVRIDVEVDPLQIEQVVANLVLNAIQASPSDAAVSLSVHMAREDGERVACVEIVDEGAGIAEEARVRIFEPFFTTKGVGKGTGLGLSVADSIVRDHGGWLEVESEHSRGCRFRVLLPLAADPV